jgi:hypothetical protein
VKLLFTALVLVAVLSGVYQFAQAGYGWFQMSGVVDDVTTKELPGIIERVQQSGGAGFETSERYMKVREGIVKGAEDAGVPLRSDGVAVGVVDNMLDVRLTWDAPIVRYNDRPYLEIPMTMQRRFSLSKRAGY